MLDDIVIDKSKLTFGYNNTITTYLYKNNWDSIESVPKDIDCRITISADGAYVNLVSCILKPEEQITIRNIVDCWIGGYLDFGTSIRVDQFFGSKEALLSNFPNIGLFLDLERIKLTARRRDDYVRITSARDLAAVVSQRFAKKYKKAVYDYIMAVRLEHAMSNI